MNASRAMGLISRLSISPELWRAGLLYVVLGFLGTGGMITLTLPYAAEVYDVPDSELGAGLAAVRVGVLLALGLGLLLDAHGRARFLVHGMVACVVGGALLGLAPAFWIYIAGHILIRMVRTALAVALSVLAVEQAGRSNRAMVLAVLGFAAGAGVVAAIAVLPLAATGRWGFAAAYGLLLLTLPLVLHLARSLPESPRFAAHLGEPRGLRELFGPALRGRVVLLGSITLLSAAFFAPLTDFFTRYLDSDHDFSSQRIVAFLVVTGAPAVVTLFVGARLGDLFGRKRVGIPLLAVSVVAYGGFYLAEGWALWPLAALAQATAAAGLSAMAPYSAELFPTRVRGAANAVLAVVTVVGSAIGLITAGLLSDPVGLGEAIAALGVLPAVAMVIAIVWLPETAHLDLDQASGELAPGRST